MSSTGLKQAITKLKRAGTKAEKAAATGAVATESITAYHDLAQTTLSPGAYPTTLYSTAPDLVLMVPIADGDNVFFDVQNHTTAAKATHRYTVLAGDQWQSDLGDATFDLSSSTSRTIKRGVFGPFESARFGYRSTSTPLLGSKGDMVLRMKFLAFLTSKGATCLPPAGQARKGHIRAFAMPKVEYDT